MNPASPIIDVERGFVVPGHKVRSNLAHIKDIVSQGPVRRTAVHILGPDSVGKSALALTLEKALIFALKYISGLTTLSGFIKIHDGEPVVSTLEEIVVLSVYDICVPKSLTTAVSEFSRNVKMGSGSNITNILVGNRIDLEYWRRISVEEGARAAMDSGPSVLYVEVSALTGMHVDRLVDIVLRRMLPNLNLTEIAALLDQILLIKQREDLSLYGMLGSSIDIDSSRQTSSNISIEDHVQRGGGGGAGLAAQKDEEVGDNDDELWTDYDAVDITNQMVMKSGAPPPPPPGLSIPPPRASMPKLSSPPAIPPSVEAKLPLRFTTTALPLASSTASASSSLAPEPQLQRSTARPTPAPVVLPPVPPSDQQETRRSDVTKQRLDAEADEELLKPPPRERRKKTSDSSTGKRQQSDKSKEKAVLIEKADVESSDIYMVEEEDGTWLSTKHDKMPDLSIDDSTLHQSQIDYVQTNLEKEVQESREEKEQIPRDESMEKIELGTDELDAAAKPFKKASEKVSGFNPLVILCLPFMLCGHCLASIGDSLGKVYKEWSAKSLLFDNVLADTENAFQTLAKFLNYLLGSPCSDGLNLCLRVMYGFWVDMIGWIISSIVVLVSTVLLILPSFFTLLIVRTTTVEKESKAFGVRQEVIRKQKKEESFVRWVRIVLRSLPMTFYILVLPYILVYHVFPTQGEEDRIATIVCYVIGVILLQILGSVRAYYSWKSREEVVPEPPALYYDPSLKQSDDGLVGQITSFLKKQESPKLLPTPRPKPPAAFDYTNPSNLMELASLTLEFFQMATFALQNNPYESTGNDPTAAPTTAPSASDESSDASTSFWGPNVFEVLYIDLPSAQDMQFIIMWSSVGVVWALILIFVGQFLMELKLYGRLMARIEDSDKAKDSFFYSFTGSIVYGHGKPRNISESMRLIVGLLSDGLFLIISFQLLQAFSCDYTGNGSPTLRADASIVCWEGRHAVVGTAALISYALYVPLSIMISPMLLEAPPKPTKPGEPPQENTGVSYMKLYLMFINTVKSIMLVVGVLGPETVTTVVISSTASSCVLGIMTILWYQSYVPTSTHYSSTPEPCNIAFINYWKAASYVAAVSSALIVIAAYELTADVFPANGLTTALIVSWIVIIVVFAVMYYRYHSKYDQRMDLVRDLITYPFNIRDYKEQAVKYQHEGSPMWRGIKEFPTRLAHIPGFMVSPWADKRAEIHQRFGVIPGGVDGDIPITGTLVTVVTDDDELQTIDIFH